MKKDVYSMPVFVHHETGEKKQAGRDKKQQYLKACITTAKESENRVILFGDQTNKEWCDEWVDVKSIRSEKWTRFKSVHENMSTYPDAWALGIFRRFFLFEQYAIDNNISEFFVLDSDILLYEKVADLYDWENVDFAAIIPEVQQLGNEISNELRWTINLGTSYWTIEALSSFLDYCIDTYSNHKDLLQKKWSFHQKYKYPGGVCEMSLAYLWVNATANLRVLNLANPKSNIMLFNGDVNGRENYKRNEFAWNPFLGIKKIRFKNSKPFLKKSSGEYVRVANLHFIGNSKLLMSDYAEKEHIGVNTRGIYVMYSIKRHGGNFYRKIRRKLKV